VSAAEGSNHQEGRALRVELRSRRISSQGELLGTVAILDDGENLVWEDSLNLSKRTKRDELIKEIASRGKVSLERARATVLKLMEEHRAAQVEVAEPGTKGEGRKADRLVEAIVNEEGAELFVDQYGEPHIAVLQEGRREICRVRGAAFRDRLANVGYMAMREVPSTETVRAALAVIAGKAAYEGQVRQLHVRTAWHDGSLWYDLGRGRAVRVCPGHWELTERPPVLFRSFSHQVPQVEPTRGGDLREFVGLVRMPDHKAELLILTDLVAGLVAGIPRPLSVFYGPHGAAKTSALRFKRMLQDPVAVPVQAPPRDVGEFIQIASHNLCVFLDNVTSLPLWLSDALCRFCTGDGFVKRVLYTTDDDFVYRPQGVGGLTGVNLCVTEPDLLDRCLIYHMERLPEGDFIPEGELEARFKKLQPGLLGGVFDTLAEAMRIRELMTTRCLPRLADYAQWGCAAAIALGCSEADYWVAYRSNVGVQTNEALDASPVAQAVLALMEERDEWNGTPGELLGEVNRIASEVGIDTTGRAWPRDATWVTRRLTVILPNLAAAGVRVRIGWSGKQRAVTLQRVKNAVGSVGTVGTAPLTPNRATDTTNTTDTKSQTLEGSEEQNNTGTSVHDSGTDGWEV